MTAPFDRPDSGGGDQFVNADHVGALLVIQPKEAIRGLETSNGAADVIVADVFVIGPPGVITEEFHDTYLFGKVLQGQLKRKIGRTVLGVLNGQPGVKVGGQNVPYTLGDPSPQQEQAAIRAMSSRPDPVQQETPASRQQPAQDPWGQQPVTPAQAAQVQSVQNTWGQPPANPWEQQTGTPAAVPGPAAPWEQQAGPPF
jgi:hypothetical protein